MEPFLVVRVVLVVVATAMGLAAMPGCVQAETKPPRCAYVDVSGFFPTEPKQHCFSLDMRCEEGQTYGCFKGELRFKEGWIETGSGPRLRELSAPFGFIDPDNVHWDVPAGYQTDGASIPLFFQVFVGGRWTESYVKAAVIHDFYIRRRSVVDADVHKVFYFALLAEGNSMSRARQMHFGVANFGPRWKSVDVDAYTQAWKFQKARSDMVIGWHKKMWEEFQASERRREAQAVIDRAVFSRPLRQREHVFRVPENGDGGEAFEAFIDGALADNIVQAERDATLIEALREQVEAEQRRPAGERSNVFVLIFSNLGAMTTSFQARNEQEFNEMLDLTDQLTIAQEQAVGPE